MNAAILLVEDDLTLRTGLADTLRQEGHEVVAAADGESAAQALRTRRFALVLLDLMLPRRSGLALLRELRARDRRTPVVILTARGDESDKVLGLELGADDYVTKPFSLRELLARVRAQLRRAQPAAPPAETFAVGDALVDLAAFELRRDGTVHPLSPKEAAILALLHAEAGKAVSRSRFLDEVWGGDRFVGTRTIDTHVLNLRQKLERDPAAPRHLLTVHGVGYRLLLQEDPA
ncbi:MAG: response regulator transcription factor [Planctomycetes bacterium]|nr:response regulator transcription factor [Planctomycetota bacterium]